jgi:hypothetical protein
MTRIQQAQIKHVQGAMESRTAHMAELHRLTNYHLMLDQMHEAGRHAIQYIECLNDQRYDEKRLARLTDETKGA